MKKFLGVFFGIFLLSMLMVSSVDAKVMRDQIFEEKPSFLTILNLGNDIPIEQACEFRIKGDGNCFSTEIDNRLFDGSRERVIVVLKNCEYRNDNCYCDYYFNDEPLFEESCSVYYDQQVSSGRCDEGIYGDNFCDEGKYVEHNGCQFIENSDKDNLCEDDGELITDPNQPEIKSSFTKFFLNIWGWITSLFGGN